MMIWLVIHAAATWCLVGLIWIIQIVHYPLLKNVGQSEFIAFHERHMALISCVVGPLMLVEISSAGSLLLLGERSFLFGISLAALALVWASTTLLQIPLHRKLTHGYNAVTIDRLVSTNRWRTLGWTIRGLCLALMLVLKSHSF
ncbi:MAG: hypothetical protein H8M99_09455 [Gloeobacteraceae cyanobacterium ES-bin-144]|nr:hypothetical protein [Verrucomicrobiales bacterium]